MSSAQFGDAGQEKLRTLVAGVEHELTLLTPADASPNLVGLRAAWENLVATMALGPSPEKRTCPKCGGIGMRAATRCGSCWTKLAVLA